MELKEVNDVLLNDVKESLFVNWTDNDEQIKKIIVRSAKYLQSKIAVEIPFSVFLDYDIENMLLIERCRYDWNNALDEFENNFGSEMLAFIQKYALMDWRAEDVGNGK